MDDKPCKNCGSYGGNVGCDVCGPPIRKRKAQERLAKTPCSLLRARKTEPAGQTRIDTLYVLDVSLLPFAYNLGNNPYGDNAYYSCGHCGFTAHAEEVGYIAAGASYANGEHSRCPRCGKENAVFRDSLD